MSIVGRDCGVSILLNFIRNSRSRTIDECIFESFAHFATGGNIGLEVVGRLVKDNRCGSTGNSKSNAITLADVCSRPNGVSADSADPDCMI